jgi:hypothetical protein
MIDSKKYNDYKILSRLEGLLIFYDVCPESPDTSLPEPFYIEILLGEPPPQHLRKLRLTA